LPDCHILAVGIDQYERSPLRGCANDARIVDEQFRNQRGKLFGQVSSKVLVDQEANDDRIEEELIRIARAGKAGDFVVLFFSGHGGPDEDGRWAFVTSDGILSDQTLLGIADRLASQGKKVVIFLDACFSGLLRVRAKQHLNKAYPDGGGLILLVSSMASQPTASGREMSPFAQAVVEGLSGKGDLDGDGFVTLREVRRYAYHRLHEIIRSTKQDGEVDYSLSVSESLRLAQVGKEAVRAAGGVLSAAYPAPRAKASNNPPIVRLKPAPLTSEFAPPSAATAAGAIAVGDPWTALVMMSKGGRLFDKR